jgi:RecB family endonuclease NucS
VGLLAEKGYGVFMKESDLQRDILEHLRILGMMAWRNSTGAFAGEYRGKKRFVRFGTVGASDIFGIDKNGRFISIEVKAKGKLPTLAQLDWIGRVNSAGGFGYWVDSWELWEKICKERGWGIKK